LSLTGRNLVATISVSFSCFNLTTATEIRLAPKTKMVCAFGWSSLTSIMPGSTLVIDGCDETVVMPRAVESDLLPK
jgi:hypothetical protein